MIIFKCDKCGAKIVMVDKHGRVLVLKNGSVRAPRYCPKCGHQAKYKGL